MQVDGSMDVILGLDLGTTNSKVLALDTNGKLVASASLPTPFHHHSTDLRNPEYDGEALWQLSARLIRDVVDQIRSNQHVVGLAVTSMGEAGVLIDKDGKPLFPILTWHDRRTQPLKAWWKTRISAEELYQITGLPLDHIYSVNKMMWLRQQSPTIFQRCTTWLSLADWITFCLTGERTTSLSQASRTMLFDVRHRGWADSLLKMAEIPESMMPPAFPSGKVLGYVSDTAAQLTGLHKGTPVAAGGHDHICAALAAGVTTPGPVLDSAGTSEAILFPLEQPILGLEAAAAGVCCGCHTAGEKYYLVGGVMSGAVTGWLGKLFAGENSAETLTGLMEEAASAPPLAHGVSFVPHLGGSGPPERDPDAWGAWLGMRLSHNRADMMRAAMEGIGFAVRNLQEGLQKVTGAPITVLRSVGGGSRNPWWQSLKADILGLPVEVPVVSDVTAQGAALLAGIAAGFYPDAEEAAKCAYQPAHRFEPDPERHDLYDKAYRGIYLHLYPRLKTLPHP